MRNQAMQSEKAIEAQWKADARAFIKANPVFSSEKNPALFGALNANIQDIASTPDADNMSNQDILREAAKRVHEQLSSIMPKQHNEATKKKSPAKKKVSDKKRQAAAKKKQVVASKKKTTTLAKAPSATSNTSKGEFAYLDSLEGAEFEEAIAKLSTKQLEKYLAQ